MSSSIFLSLAIVAFKVFVTLVLGPYMVQLGNDSGISATSFKCFLGFQYFCALQMSLKLTIQMTNGRIDKDTASWIQVVADRFPTRGALARLQLVFFENAFSISNLEGGRSSDTPATSSSSNHEKEGKTTKMLERKRAISIAKLVNTMSQLLDTKCEAEFKENKSYIQFDSAHRIPAINIQLSDSFISALVVTHLAVFMNFLSIFAIFTLLRRLCNGVVRLFFTRLGCKEALTKHVENVGSFLVRFYVDSTYISYGSRAATPSCCDIWLESS